MKCLIIYYIKVKKIIGKYYKRLEYFSKVPLLISDMTSSNFYTNTKCCIDFHIYKKKDKRKLKLNNYHLNKDIFN